MTFTSTLLSSDNSLYVPYYAYDRARINQKRRLIRQAEEAVKRQRIRETREMPYSSNPEVSKTQCLVCDQHVDDNNLESHVALHSLDLRDLVSPEQFATL